MKKVHAKPHFVDGIRNLHCCNVEPHGGCCDYKSHWQQGGGTSDRTYIYCDALHCRVYLDPPIPTREQSHKEDFYFLIPDECPVLRTEAQLSIFDLIGG